MIGGLVDFRFINVVECYDFSIDIWIIENIMKETRVFYGCVII